MNPGARKVVLPRKDVFRLTTLVQAEYATSGLSDVEFAAYAAVQLEVPQINQNHVQGVRRDFDIPSNLAKMPGGWKQALERRLKAVEDRLEVYIKGSR